LEAEGDADAAPHPWIATAPPGIARLIDQGRVRIVIDDQRLSAAGLHALTEFRLQYDYGYRAQPKRPRPMAEDPTQMQTEVVATLRSKRIDCEHTIVLKKGFLPIKPWEHPLMLHEFDHVSISTDPRFLKIAKDVLEQPVRCSVQWTKTDGLTKQLLDRAIKDAVSARIVELERVVQANYNELDRVSDQGQVNLKDRYRFFTTLYGKERLRACEFLYLDVLRSAAQDSSDKDVLEHYLSTETP
jgi:hypothetical protein